MQIDSLEIPFMRAHYFIVVALGCTWLTGCDSEHFRAETRLLADGSVERIVYQPLARTPKQAQQPKVWQESYGVLKAEQPLHQRMPLRDLMRRLQIPVPSQHKSTVPYWMAAGKFADASAIPDHLEFEAPEGLPSGRLTRQLERQEAGFVTEWIWQETLTDVVTGTDHRVARNEAADLFASLTIAACADVWGPDYDLKKLEDWLRGDLTKCFQELCDAVLETSLNKKILHAESKPLMEQALKILKRYGLDLLDAQQQLIKDQTESENRLRKFVTENLQRLVRDKNDRPLKDELLQDTLQTLWPRSDDSRETKLKQALHRAAIARFGTDEKLDKEMSRLPVRIFGLYQSAFFQGKRNFDYRLDFPGVLVETNGILVGDRTVCWKFDAIEAFPLGYPMRAVMAIVNTAALEKHFPRARFDRREILTEYLSLVRADDELRGVLNALVKENDVVGWKAWQVDHLDSTLLELLQPKVSAEDAK